MIIVIFLLGAIFVGVAYLLMKLFENFTEREIAESKAADEMDAIKARLGVLEKAGMSPATAP